MPITLSPSGSFGPGTVTGPVGGEARSSASVRTMAQQLLDQTGWLKALVDAGVLKVRSLANVAALKAVAGQATGDHRVVKDLGLFEFDGGSSATSDDVTVVTPTVGGGRWLHVNRGARVANGFAPLDAAAKVPNANLRGVLSASQSASPSTTSGTLGGVIHETYSSILTISLAIGEVLAVAGRASFSFGGGYATTEDVQAYLVLAQPDTSLVEVPGARTTLRRAATLDKHAGLSGFFRAAQAGTHTLKLFLGYSVVPGGVTYSVQSSPAPFFEVHRLSAP